jgi:hypothetical protein
MITKPDFQVKSSCRVLFGNKHGSVLIATLIMLPVMTAIGLSAYQFSRTYADKPQIMWAENTANNIMESVLEIIIADLTNENESQILDYLIALDIGEYASQYYGDETNPKEIKPAGNQLYRGYQYFYTVKKVNALPGWETMAEPDTIEVEVRTFVNWTGNWNRGYTASKKMIQELTEPSLTLDDCVADYDFYAGRNFIDESRFNDGVNVTMSIYAGNVYDGSGALFNDPNANAYKNDPNGNTMWVCVDTPSPTVAQATVVAKDVGADTSNQTYNVGSPTILARDGYVGSLVDSTVLSYPLGPWDDDLEEENKGKVATLICTAEYTEQADIEKCEQDLHTDCENDLNGQNWFFTGQNYPFYCSLNEPRLPGVKDLSKDFNVVKVTNTPWYDNWNRTWSPFPNYSIFTESDSANASAVPIAFYQAFSAFNHADVNTNIVNWMNISGSTAESLAAGIANNDLPYGNSWEAVILDKVSNGNINTPANLSVGGDVNMYPGTFRENIYFLDMDSDGEPDIPYFFYYEEKWGAPKNLDWLLPEQLKTAIENFKGQEIYLYVHGSIESFQLRDADLINVNGEETTLYVIAKNDIEELRQWNNDFKNINMVYLAGRDMKLRTALGDNLGNKLVTMIANRDIDRDENSSWQLTTEQTVIAGRDIIRHGVFDSALVSGNSSSTCHPQGLNDCGSSVSTGLALGRRMSVY